MIDRAHVQVIRDKHNRLSSIGRERTQTVSINLASGSLQVIKISRHYCHEALRNQKLDQSEKQYDGINRKVISLPNNTQSIGQKSINANNSVQISLIVLDSDGMNKLKQASKTTVIPPVNIKRNDSYLPALLQSRQSKCDYLNNYSINAIKIREAYERKQLPSIKIHSTQNYQNMIINNLNASYQKNRNKKQGFFDRYCVCPILCKLLLLLVCVFLGAMIPGITIALLPSRKTTITTTVITPIATSVTITTSTTDIPCIPSCNSEQACINNICTNVGLLACTLTWSRPGDGDIVVKTPNNRTIYYNNRGPSATTDGGQLDRDDQVGTGPENVYWTSNGTAPPTGTYYVCFEPYSISPTISTIDPITAVYYIIDPSGIIHVFTRIFTSVLRNSYNCDSTATTLIGSFTYP